MAISLWFLGLCAYLVVSLMNEGQFYAGSPNLLSDFDYELCTTYVGVWFIRNYAGCK